MIIPVRCFTCGKVLANKWEYYQNRVQQMEDEHKGKMEKDGEQYKNLEPVYKKAVLDELGLTKMCCRRHMLAHIDMIDII